MQLSDKLLLIRVQDQKLIRFLEKVGYEVIQKSELADVSEFLASNPVDAILLDGVEENDSANFVEFLKAQPKLKELPLFFFAHDNLQVREVALKHVSKVEVFEKPYGIGSVASKIATELRLRKFKGSDEATATLSEVNASLRDLTGRLKKDLEEARAIQQNLLPKKLPGDKRYEIAASYEPLEEVGGDWFFVSKTPEEKVSVQIADVTGHGLSAAFIGSMAKLALIASDTEQPHELLARMNALMAPQMPDGKFVTMFSYLYDPASGDIQYARAGHPPGLLLKRQKKEVVQLLGDGFAVGFFDDSEYSSDTAHMDVDDLLLVYTDAFPESMNMKGECYGTERLEEFMLSLPPDTSAGDAIGELISHFEEFRGGRILKDDVTVVALRRKE